MIGLPPRVRLALELTEVFKMADGERGRYLAEAKRRAPELADDLDLIDATAATVDRDLVDELAIRRVIRAWRAGEPLGPAA